MAGTGSGIGEAMARRLHAEGAGVVLTDIKAAPVEATAAELGERASALQLDVRDEDAVSEAVRDVPFWLTPRASSSTTSAPDTPLDISEDVFRSDRARYLPLLQPQSREWSSAAVARS